MKEHDEAAKEGGDSDPMKVMREQYERLTEPERPNRSLGLDDLRFVAVPGNQWDESAKKARKNRPCYEFPILRAHWRQVVNDQKKARPAIKVRGLRDATTEGAELRQGLIRNVESVSHASLAYDAAHELLTAAGMGAWRVGTRYSEDDSWEQDFYIGPIKDPLNSVWLAEDRSHGFVEETISRDEFTKRWPKAEAVDFDTNGRNVLGDWFGQDEIRIAEWWRKVPVTKTICLLSDGRSVDADEFAQIADELAAQGVECVKQRPVQTHKVVMSIVSGKEELDGPHDSVFHEIPLVVLYANRHYVDGKWHWMGMVRPSRDPQKLVNYNFTAGQEALAKQHKSTPIVTPKMLEGDGVKRMWDNSNAADTPYLPITPDPQMPGGPQYLTAPPIQNGFVQMGQMSIDMLKASDGIYDASVGARTNETSGRAINARREEGDTATFDYQDKLAEGIRFTGELIGRALHKVYDTPRAVRILGKDGAEDWKQLYQEVRDEQTGQVKVINDLSAGKYDYSVSTGPSYDTQRLEFVDMLVQLSQGNPLVQQAVPDLIVGAMDFPKADEAAERLKLFLPPQVQQSLQKDAQMPPEVVAAMQQIEQMGQQLQQGQAMLQEEAQKVAQERVQVESAKSDVDSALAKLAAEQKVLAAEFAQKRTELENMFLKWQASQKPEEGEEEAGKPAKGSSAAGSAGDSAVAYAVAQSLSHTVEKGEQLAQVLQQAEAVAERIEQAAGQAMEAAAAVSKPRTKRGTMRREADGTHSFEVVEE